jgi:glutamine cyclotransferase
MNPSSIGRKLSSFGLLASVAAFAVSFFVPSAYGQIFITNYGGGVAEFDTITGAPINTSFVSGLQQPFGLARSDNDLYVSQITQGDAWVGKYDATTGLPIKAPLIDSVGPVFLFNLAISGNNLYVATPSGVIQVNATTGAIINPLLVPGNAEGLAVSGNDLYVADGVHGVGEYNATTGAAINFINTHSLSTEGLAISGNNLYVACWTSGTVGEYNATTGETINASLITGLDNPRSVAVLGNMLYVPDYYTGTVGEYNATTGEAINTSFITGLGYGGVQSIIAVSAVPEPSTYAAIMGLASVGFVMFRRRLVGSKKAV